MASSNQTPVSSRTRAAMAVANSSLTGHMGTIATEVAEMAGQTVEMVKNVRKPALPTPTFDGSTDVDDFISQFEKVAAFMDWEDDEKSIRFQMAVSGTARKGLTSNTFDGICTQLRSRYQLSETGSIALLKALKWKTNDNVHEFAAYVRRLVNTAFAELDEDQREQRAIKELTNALPSSCNTLIWELRNRTPGTYEDVIDMVQSFNEMTVTPKVNKVETEEVSSLRKEVATQAELIQQMVATQMEMQKQLTAVLSKSKPRRDNSSIVCYHCRKEGHIAWNCKAPLDTNPQKNGTVQ